MVASVHPKPVTIGRTKNPIQQNSQAYDSIHRAITCYRLLIDAMTEKFDPIHRIQVKLQNMIHDIRNKRQTKQDRCNRNNLYI